MWVHLGLRLREKESVVRHADTNSFAVIIEASIENKPASSNGKTLDISMGGVYFVFDDDLDVGMRLGLTRRLPTGPTDGMHVFIRVIGQVVRVEKGGEDGVIERWCCRRH